MLEKVLLVFMIVLAIISLNTAKLRRTVIYLAIFSLVSSFVFLLYSAPDVAIAEAIMAAALTTVLYLVAIKKHKTITIYYISDENEQVEISNIRGWKLQILKDMEGYCIEKELEPQIVCVSQEPEELLERDVFDFLVYKKENKIFVYGFEKDHQLNELEALFASKIYDDFEVSIIRCKEGGI